MSVCPFAAWMPVQAHGGPIGTILGVVIHVTAGEGDPYNEFANPNNQVSSHFGILNGQGGTIDGRIEQYVDTGFDSWAQMAGNNTYISVETEGEPTEPLTSAQVASFAKVLAWCNQVHGIPLVVTDTPGTGGLITHGDGGVAWGNHIGCPGPLRSPQRQDILNAIHPPPITPTEAFMPVSPATGFGGQSHLFQVNGNHLWHKWWGPSGPQDNEDVYTAAGLGHVDIPDQTPQVAIVVNQLTVAVEDGTGKAWYFGQSSGGPWGAKELI
jgi:hypothetical protein